MSTKKFKIKNGLDVNNQNIENIGTLQGGGENLTVSELDEIVNATPSGSSETLERADSNIMLNAFRIASNNALIVFQMIDSIVDEYIDESGIDTASSTNEVYNSGGDYYSPSLATNMTLISESFTAETEPDTARITMLLEEVGAFTLSTDLEVSISKDGGSTFDIVTIEDIGLFDSNKKILAGMVTLTSIGITMKYKIKTFNGTDVKIHAVGLSWD